MIKTQATDGLKKLVGEVFTNPHAIGADPVAIANATAERTTAMEGKAFAAAFYYKPLRFVVRLFWLVYRFGRWSGALPAASDEPWN